MATGGGLVCAVSTVKDTLPRLQQYVARNLANGVDHLFVMLDTEEPETQAALGAHDHVTCIRTGRDWWQGERPTQLNHRQRINANAVSEVLARSGVAAWLFHIDGDEVVRVDRGRLGAVPESTRAVRLATREAVSQAVWEHPPTYFKRPLGRVQLGLLAELGVISSATNGAYFHGHFDGKSGVRPGTGAWLTLHDPIDDDRSEVPQHTDESFVVLHYESYSAEEFARKWQSLIEAGPDVKFRKGRQGTMAAVQALASLRLPREVTDRYLLRIFERTTADDLEVLRDLQLVDEIDADAGTHEPASLGDDQAAALDAAVREVTALPKARFRPPAVRPVKGEGNEQDEPAHRGVLRRR